jgi:hypothetical protein
MENKEYLNDLLYFDKYITLLESGKPYDIKKEEPAILEKINMIKAVLEIHWLADPIAVFDYLLFLKSECARQLQRLYLLEIDLMDKEEEKLKKGMDGFLIDVGIVTMQAQLEELYVFYALLSRQKTVGNGSFK